MAEMAEMKTTDCTLQDFILHLSAVSMSARSVDLQSRSLGIKQGMVKAVAGGVLAKKRRADGGMCAPLHGSRHFSTDDTGHTAPMHSILHQVEALSAKSIARVS
jgi:hypothetical protein